MCMFKTLPDELIAGDLHITLRAASFAKISQLGSSMEKSLNLRDWVEVEGCGIAKFRGLMIVWSGLMQAQ